ncbi:MFS transporter [archaeon]|nr:MFS transporter [archaeon]
MQTYRLSILKIIKIALVHIGVGILIVIISSFLNSEMKFNNWRSDQISFYLGLPIIFEFIRLIFSHYYDSKNIIRPSLIFALLISSIGIFSMQFFILPVANIGLLISVGLFYMGSSILTTLVDGNLTKISAQGDRGRIAAVIQVFRLSGFALGGIVGSILYPEIEFGNFLNLFLIIYITIGLISVLSIEKSENDYTYNADFRSNLKNLFILLKENNLPKLMTIFLMVYPIGLYMQDLIFEPFVIDVFDFDKNNVGSVVTLWTSLTLIFTPLGIIIGKKTKIIIPIFFGSSFATIGLMLFIISSMINSISILYGGLILFGIGNGIASGPAIELMLEVCGSYKNLVTVLLGFFGLMTTLGRFLAAILGALILAVTSNNYQFLFLIESLFIFVGYIPLYFVIRIFEKNN